MLNTPDVASSSKKHPNPLSPSDLPSKVDLWIFVKETSRNKRNMNRTEFSKTHEMLNFHGLSQLQVKMGKCIRLSVKSILQ